MTTAYRFMHRHTRNTLALFRWNTITVLLECR